MTERPVCPKCDGTLSPTSVMIQPRFITQDDGKWEKDTVVEGPLPPIRRVWECRNKYVEMNGKAYPEYECSLPEVEGS